MRRISFFALLAASALPAVAQDDDQRVSSRQSEESSIESGGDREAYGRDTGRSDRPAMATQVDRPEREDRQGPGRDQAQAFEAQRAAQAGAEAQVRAQLQDRAQFERRGMDGARGSDVRRRDFDGRRQGLEAAQNPQQDERQADGWQPRQRRIRTIPDVSATQQAGMTGPERPASTIERRHYREGRGWDHRWRNDSRYDWRRWRNRYRSAFRLGFYYDPFGWDYRRFRVGSYIWPSYYGSRYWINDPWHYRLPRAYAPYRWVRYHNDALLIDSWTGEVVDVIYGFFW